MNKPTLARLLESIPRQPFAHLPTPLEPLDRLSRELGGPRIWLKRDDCTGLATGGNKARKLEYLMAAALAEGADTVVTHGAVQSNHARQTAAACARLGLSCHLILSQRVPVRGAEYATGGNVLLNDLLGATVHLVTVEEARDFSESLQHTLRQEGRAVFSIPAGGSSAAGALGYARCALELTEQGAALGFSLTHISHASSSGGTQAGLLAGLSVAAPDVQVCGFNVFHNDPETLRGLVARLADQTARQFLHTTVAADRVLVNHAYLGEGYGLPDRRVADALRLAASLEGVILDPVYSGKAFAGFIDQIDVGAIGGDNVVFIHTGGQAVLGAYRKQLLS